MAPVHCCPGSRRNGSRIYTNVRKQLQGFRFVSENKNTPPPISISVIWVGGGDMERSTEKGGRLEKKENRGEVKRMCSSKGKVNIKRGKIEAKMC